MGILNASQTQGKRVRTHTHTHTVKADCALTLSLPWSPQQKWTKDKDLINTLKKIWLYGISAVSLEIDTVTIKHKMFKHIFQTQLTFNIKDSNEKLCFYLHCS